MSTQIYHLVQKPTCIHFPDGFLSCVYFGWQHHAHSWCFFVLDMAGLCHVGTLEKKTPWTGILSSWISPPYQASE